MRTTLAAARPFGWPALVVIFIVGSAAGAWAQGHAATSTAGAADRYRAGDSMGALVVWNRAGEPRIDVTDIHGADRTRPSVIGRAAGLRQGQLLTPEAFGRALRRLRDMPAISTAEVTFEPASAGRARVDVSIEERRLVPSGWVGLGTVGARAILLDELKIDVAGPMGAGELVTGAWRWAAARPRLSLGLALPSPIWFRGIVGVEAAWERQTYAQPPAALDAAPVREERRRVGLRVGDWSSGWLHWQAGAAYDRLAGDAGAGTSPIGARDYFAAESTLDARFAGNRVALVLSGGSWTPVRGGDRFGAAGVLAAWRSTELAAGPSWSAVAGVDVASRLAPLALWPGAGTGQGRAGLLRAHPLLTDGVLTGTVFGREVARGSIEYARPVGNLPGGGLALAGFVDAARAWHRLPGLGTSSLYVDAGLGIRMHAPGPGGAIRVDVAHGLRGGGTTLSAGWGGSWPR